MDKTLLSRRITSQKQTLTHWITQHILIARLRDAERLTEKLRNLCDHHPSKDDDLNYWKIAVFWWHMGQPHRARKTFNLAKRTPERKRFWEPLELRIVNHEEEDKYGFRVHPANTPANERVKGMHRAVPIEHNELKLGRVFPASIENVVDGEASIGALDLYRDETVGYAITIKDWEKIGWPIKDIDPMRPSPLCEIGFYSVDGNEPFTCMLVRLVEDSPPPPLWCETELRERFLQSCRPGTKRFRAAKEAFARLTSVF